jgi:hypothetical protein
LMPRKFWWIFFCNKIYPFYSSSFYYYYTGFPPSAVFFTKKKPIKLLSASKETQWCFFCNPSFSSHLLSFRIERSSTSFFLLNF